MTQLTSVFPALRHRNYRLFFFGQGTSLIGTWMQQIAMGWLVYRISDSAFVLGVVGFSSQILTFAVSPFAGVLADRTSRKRLLLATQAVAMLQAFVLGALTLGHVIAVWHIILLSLVLGLVNAFDIPIRQAFVVEMLESRSDLPNAIALNSFLVNSAKLVGPSIAGVLIALLGEGPCFLLNGASFVAVIAALLAMKVTEHRPKPSPNGVLKNLKEGMLYAYGIVPMRAVLLLLAFNSLVGLSVIVLFPVYAKKILQHGPDTFGLMMAASGTGAIGAALLLARRNAMEGLERLISRAAFLLGLSLVALSLSRSFPGVMASVAVMGFATMTMLASCNTFLQSRVDDDKRGRVMSLYTMAFMGMTPFGSLLLGTMASRLGTPWTVAVAGIASLVAAAAFSRFARMGAADATRSCSPPNPALPAGHGGCDTLCGGTPDLGAETQREEKQP